LKTKKENLIFNSSVYFDILGCLSLGINSVPLITRFLKKKGVKKSEVMVLKQIKRLNQEGYISNGDMYYLTCNKCSKQYITEEQGEVRLKDCVCGGKFEKKKKVGNEKSYSIFNQRLNEDIYNYLYEKNKSISKFKKDILSDTVFSYAILGVMQMLIGNSFTIRELMEYYILNYEEKGEYKPLSEDKLHNHNMKIAKKMLKEDTKELKAFKLALNHYLNRVKLRK
jgi:hypothetical protein